MKKYNVVVYIEEAEEEEFRWCDLGNHEIVKTFNTEKAAQDYINKEVL